MTLLAFLLLKQRLITAGSLRTELEVAIVLSQHSHKLPLPPSQMPEGNNWEDKVLWICGKMADWICHLYLLNSLVSAERNTGEHTVLLII